MVNIELIKQQVDEIKIDLEVLKKQANEFKSGQEHFPDEIKKEKSLLLKKKKEEIEIKRKETEKMLIDIKLEQLDQAQLQKVIETEEELKKIGLELEELKQKNRLGRQREAVWSKEEWKKNTGANIARTVGGLGIAALTVRGIRKLFGRGKKKEQKEGEAKEEKKTRWKRALLWAGIGTGGILLRKNWDSIIDRLGLGKEKKEGDGDTDDITKSGKEFVERLTEHEKGVYNNFASQVNAFYESGAGEFPQELKKDKLGLSSFEVYENENIPGMVPFMLNNRYTRYGGIDGLLSESAFYKEAGMTDKEDGIWKILRTWSADALQGFLAPIAVSIDGMLPVFVAFKTSGMVNDLIDWIQGSPEARASIRLAFRKSIMAISYLNSKEKSLKYTVAANYLSKHNAKFANLSEQKQQEMVFDSIVDDEFYNAHIAPDIDKFRAMSLYEGIQFLEEKKCLDAQLDPMTQKVVDDIQERKDDLLDQDEDGNNNMEDIRDEFENGQLSTEGKGKLEDLLDNFEEDIDEIGSKSWYNTYIPLMNFFDPSDQIMETIMQSGDYEATIKVYKDSILEIREKLKNGNLQESDLDSLQKTIDDYFVSQTSLGMSQVNIEDVVDKNGNYVIRRWRTIVISGETLIHGGELLAEKKYLKGGLIVAGSLVSLDIATYPIRLGLGLLRGRIASSPSLRFSYNVGKFVVKQGAALTGKSLNVALRNHMPARIAAKMYQGKEHMFRLELARGNISLDKAVKIAEKNAIKGRVSGNIIANREELIQRMAGIGNSADDMKHVHLIEKYWHNKNVMKHIITPEYKGKRYRITGRAERYAYRLNPGPLQELQKIDDFLVRCTHQGKAALIDGFLKTTKSFKPHIIDELFATKTFDALDVKASKQIGKLLGKKMHKFTSLEDFQKFQGYFARNYVKYPNQSFVRNSLSKRGKLRNLDDVAQSKYIEAAKLHTSRYEKIATKVKSGVNRMIKDLNKLLKNPKMKTFYTGIQNKIHHLTQYSKTVTPESVRAANNAGRLDKMAGFGKLTNEGIQALKSLQVLIKTDEKILSALSKATKVDDIKDILRNVGIAVDKIDDSVLLKIAQTKKISKIESIINYGANYAGVKTLKAVLKNPVMKTFGRRLGIAGVAVDAVFVVSDFISDTNEASRIKQHNMLRGQNKEDEAYFDVITGGISTGLFAFGLFNVWNPVGRACIIGGFAAMGVEGLGNLYYGEIDKFRQNYQDFLAQSLPEIKQRLVYINNWQTGLEGSFQDSRSKLTGNLAKEEKKKLSVNTVADAVRAIIYFEEMQKYPYAIGDLNSAEVRQNPALEITIKEQKRLHEESVASRYEYIKTKYIDGKNNIVSKDAMQKDQGVQVLNQILLESTIYQVALHDDTRQDKKDVLGYQASLQKTLQERDKKAYESLEKLFVSKRLQMFEMAASLPYYEQMLQEFLLDDPMYDGILPNIEFFKSYLNYKLLGIPLSEYTQIRIDPNKIDYDQMTELFTSFSLSPTKIVKEDITNRENISYLTDEQVINKYKVSRNLGQNILYEIAIKHLGYTGENTLAQLKMFYTEDKKDIHGIYFQSDKYWTINENRASDNEFAKDQDLDSVDAMIKMRNYLYNAANRRITGKMVSNNATANREYAREYMKIINDNVEYRLNPTKYGAEILQYIKTHSNGQYIQLDPDLLIRGIKIGIPDIGAFVYARDGKKIDAKSGIPGTVSWIEKYSLSIK